MESRSPEARNAYKITGQALRAGTLQVPDRCERCGRIPRQRNHIHAHHDNYFHPLKIRWLCSKCHRQWHIAEAKFIREFYGL
jgi:hypothetical protein